MFSLMTLIIIAIDRNHQVILVFEVHFFRTIINNQINLKNDEQTISTKLSLFCGNTKNSSQNTSGVLGDYSGAVFQKILGPGSGVIVAV